MPGGAAVTRNMRKLNKSKSSNKPTNSESQENSLVQANLHDLEKPIKCPDCDRRFQSPCHLKYHYVVHKPSSEKSKNSESDGSKKGKTKKEKAEAGISEGDDVTLSKKRRSRDIESSDSTRIEVQEAASSDRAPFSDVSNKEISSPVPGSVAIEEPSPKVSSAVHSEAPSGYDDPKPEISATAEENQEAEPAAVASAAQVEDAAVVSKPDPPECDSTESSKEPIIEPSPELTAVPEAIESQPQPAEPGEQLEPAEVVVPNESVGDEPASLNTSNCTICETQLGVKCCMRHVGELSPTTFPYLDSEEQFVKGTSYFVDGIELAENITTNANFFRMVAVISGRNRRRSCAAGDGEEQPSTSANDPSLDHLQDEVPDDYYNVLWIISLQQKKSE